MEACRRADWSGLCTEILSLIAGNLETQLDAHNFRSVFKNWSYSISSQIPKTLPIISSGYPSFQITANAVCLLRSRKFPESKPFLITVEEFEKGFKLVCLSNPSSIDNSFKFFRRKSGIVYITELTRHQMLSLDSNREFDDIVEFQNRVFILHGKGILYAFSYDSKLKYECVVSNPHVYHRSSQKRLVVDDRSNVLYLIVKGNDIYNCGRIHLEVCKLNEEGGNWVKVRTIGKDRVLFVGADWCFFASTADFPGCRGNCVVFHESSFSPYKEKEYEIRVFHLEDGDGGLISGYPEYTGVLWSPPPSWILQRDLQKEIR
ncbi:uncharacterized protein [Spinacia oleracea]|uniref:KIB1-4 beta-propeller domain-containing protein n=1 Tax=Spinacia oleracea TaxID=3562 RepID=A0ABM3QLZ3_SPIOL|nr:uncharacterized protein LOC130460818 [Spinacia oleracea]